MYTPFLSLRSWLVNDTVTSVQWCRSGDVVNAFNFGSWYLSTWYVFGVSMRLPTYHMSLAVMARGRSKSCQWEMEVWGKAPSWFHGQSLCFFRAKLYKSGRLLHMQQSVLCAVLCMSVLIRCKSRSACYTYTCIALILPAVSAWGDGQISVEVHFKFWLIVSWFDSQLTHAADITRWVRSCSEEAYMHFSSLTLC